MSTVNNDNKNKDFGTYTFKGETFALANAKKFVAKNGNELIAAPVGVGKGMIYAIALDTNAYRNAMKQHVTGAKQPAEFKIWRKASLKVSDIAEIKITKLQPEIRETLENVAAGFIGNAAAAKQKVSNDTKEKLQQTPNIIVTAVKPDETAETKKSKSVELLRDSVHNKVQGYIANALHKVFDDKLEVTPKSSIKDYEILSPYKIAIRLENTAETKSKTSIGGAIIIYCAANITNDMEYIGHTSFARDKCAYDNEQFTGATRSDEEVVKSIKPSLNCSETDKPYGDKSSQFGYSSYIIMTKEDFLTMSGKSVNFDFNNLIETLPEHGALVGVATTFDKTFDAKGDIEKQVVNWVKGMCKKIVSDNPEIFRTKK